MSSPSQGKKAKVPWERLSQGKNKKLSRFQVWGWTNGISISFRARSGTHWEQTPLVAVTPSFPLGRRKDFLKAGGFFVLTMDTSWSLPEFRLGDTFDRLPAPSLWLVRWGKAEEEEEPFRMGPHKQRVDGFSTACRRLSDKLSNPVKHNFPAGLPLSLPRARSRLTSHRSLAPKKVGRFKSVLPKAYGASKKEKGSPSVPWT